MLTQEQAVLLVVDLQEKLVQAMHEKQALVEIAAKVVQGAKILGLPILCTEQNPRGLGHTVPEVSELLSDIKPISKLSFSCCGEPRFVEELLKLNRKQALLCGIESHVCVYQTAADLIKLGWEVHVVTDAVSSRTLANKNVGLERCKELGALLTSAETALFELLKVAEGDEFKQMLKVVK
ncbi:MAG: hydrolase [Desulfomonilaceae bacterium]